MTQDKHKPSKFAEMERKLAKKAEIPIIKLDHRLFQMFKAEKAGIRRVYGKLVTYGPHHIIIQHNFGKYRYDTGYDINDYWICDNFLGMVAVWDKDTRTERLLPLQYYLTESEKGRKITREPAETISFENFGLPVEKSAEILDLQATLNTELQGLSRDYNEYISEERPATILPPSSSSSIPIPSESIHHPAESGEIGHKPLRLSRRKKAKLSALFK